MAVADVEKVEKIEKAEKAPRPETGKSGSGGDGGGFLSGPLGFLPRKWRELRTFLVEVRAELKKVTWPGRNEVYATTIVVMATTVFFGFYLYGLDLALSQLFSRILRH